MEELMIKSYQDFSNVVNILCKNKEVVINISLLDNKIKTRILDLIAGYLYEKGSIEKESVFKYILKLY